MIAKYWITIKENKLFTNCGVVSKIPNGGIELAKDTIKQVISGESKDFYTDDYVRKTEQELIDSGVVSDNRGIYYNKTTQEKREITKVGKEVPDTYTNIEPPSKYHEWVNDGWVLNQEKKDEADAIEEQRIEDAKDITKADKMLKAVALVMADLTGKTPQEMKTLVKEKYNTL